MSERAIRTRSFLRSTSRPRYEGITVADFGSLIIQEARSRSQVVKSLERYPVVSDDKSVTNRVRAGVPIPGGRSVRFATKWDAFSRNKKKRNQFRVATKASSFE